MCKCCECSIKNKRFQRLKKKKKAFIAKELLNEMYKKGTFIRLVGVRVDNLVDKDEVQLSLFNDESNKKQEKLDEVVDKLKDKYGYTSITRARKTSF